MTIRKIQKSDNHALARLIRQVFEEHNAPRQGTVYSDPTTDKLFELFEQEKSILWVAEVDNEVLGCCGVFPTKGLPQAYAEIVKFYLLPKARGKKLGTQLLMKSIESAKELGYSHLYIESLPQFGNAVRMYEKLGFEELNKPLGESGHTSCNIWMLKSLKET